MSAIEQFISVLLFIIVHKVDLSFACVEEIPFVKKVAKICVVLPL